jgi:hypothetical protein
VASEGGVCCDALSDVRRPEGRNGSQRRKFSKTRTNIYRELTIHNSGRPRKLSKRVPEPPLIDGQRFASLGSWRTQPPFLHEPKKKKKKDLVVLLVFFFFSIFLGGGEGRAGGKLGLQGEAITCTAQKTEA